MQLSPHTCSKVVTSDLFVETYGTVQRNAIEYGRVCQTGWGRGGALFLQCEFQPHFHCSRVKSVAFVYMVPVVSYALVMLGVN